MLLQLIFIINGVALYAEEAICVFKYIYQSLILEVQQYQMDK